MTVYESLVRPLLFLLPPEPAHKLGRRALAGKQPWQAMSGRFQVRDSRLETEVAGLRLRSPIGLSAGFDKDVETLPGVSRLGFGVVTVGTIMPKPRAGNPGPRLLRRTREMGLVNSLGLPSKGLEYAVGNLSRRRESHPAGGPVVIANIGGFSVEEILTSHRAVEPWVDAVEIDWICPNQKERPDLNEMDHTAPPPGSGFGRAPKAPFPEAAPAHVGGELAEGAGDGGHRGEVRSGGRQHGRGDDA